MNLELTEHDRAELELRITETIVASLFERNYGYEELVDRNASLRDWATQLARQIIDQL